MRVIWVAVVLAWTSTARAQVGTPPEADQPPPAPAETTEPAPPVEPAPAPAPAPAPPPTVAPAAAPVVSDSALWLGAELDLQPTGSLHLGVGPQEVNVDSNSPLGIGAIVDLRLSPFITIGLAPRVLLDVKVKGSLYAGREYDLRGRVRAGNFVAPRWHLHGVGTVGYSWITDRWSVFDTNGDIDHYFTSKGLILGAGAGVAYTINPRLLFTGEISYQAGFHGAHEMGEDVEASSSFLTFGFGIVTSIR